MSVAPTPNTCRGAIFYVHRKFNRRTSPTVMRRPFPKDIKTNVLLTYRRRCAFCYGLDGDASVKEGHLAHIDKPEDTNLTNAAFLCLLHHAQYDTRSRQIKTFTPEELRRYQRELLDYLKESRFSMWAEMKRPRSRKKAVKRRKGRQSGVSLELYDRRIPI
jgi:predicted restriction endonuclease